MPPRPPCTGQGRTASSADRRHDRLHCASTACRAPRWPGSRISPAPRSGLRTSISTARNACSRPCCSIWPMPSRCVWQDRIAEASPTTGRTADRAGRCSFRSPHLQPEDACRLVRLLGRCRCAGDLSPRGRKPWMTHGSRFWSHLIRELDAGPGGRVRDASETALGLEAFYDGLWLNMLLYPKISAASTAASARSNIWSPCFPQAFRWPAGRCLAPGLGRPHKGPDRMARDPRYDILFQPVRHRPGHDEEPLLPGAALHRHGLGPTQDPGRDARRSRPKAAGAWSTPNTARSTRPRTTSCTSRPRSGTTPTSVTTG